MRYNTGMKLLLVDDEEYFVKYLTKILEDHKYSVTAITNGHEALNYIELEHQSIDLILLDLMLPGLDGVEICQRIRDEDIMTPVLMLTAKGNVDDKVTGLEIGADDYLTKPFDVKELLARIHALLRRPQQAIMHKIILGDIVIIPEKRKVYLLEEEIKLTLREYELLEYLATHRNQILNREQIIDKVWDTNYNAFSNVIDVHMKNLRKKLHLAEDNPLIETIRGIGYRVNV